MAFGRSMATAVMCVWLVTGAMRGAVGHLVDVMDQPLPGVDVLRALTAVNYMLLGLSGMAVLGLMMLGVSVAVLRGRALARWFGLVGLGCSVVTLLATLAQYGAYVTLVAILWSFCLAFALARTSGGIGDVGDRGVQRGEQLARVHGERDAVVATPDRDGPGDPLVGDDGQDGRAAQGRDGAAPVSGDRQGRVRRRHRDAVDPQQRS
jgi:hypothetical protein